MKNKKFTVLVGLLMAVAVTGYSVSGTYAKYTEDFSSVTNTATIAKWAVKVNEQADSTQKFDFDLFGAGETGKDAITGNYTRALYPGLSGSATITVENSGDVAATVLPEFTVVDGFAGTTGATTGVPLTYTVKIGSTAIATDVTDLAAVDFTTNNTAIANDDTLLTANANGGQVVITIEWEWDSTGNDDADTAIGKAAAADVNKTVVVTADVTVSQKTA